MNFAKAAILGLGLISTGLFANPVGLLEGNVAVQSFTVSRDGGGQNDILVTLNDQQQVQLKTTSCAFRELTEDEQKQTQVTLTADEATDALAILGNKAILASNETPVDPMIVGGTWVSLSVKFQIKDARGRTLDSEKTIASPLVLVDGKLSDVLSQIERIGSTAAESICQ